MLDAAELRRASATDVAAVQQYLQTIEKDELDALLEQFADAERKKKSDGDTHEWLALVHVLLRTEETRQRTATVIIRSLWRGHASEMEALKWISEISLAYVASASTTHTAAKQANGKARQGSQEAQGESVIIRELAVMFKIVLQFVHDTMTGTEPRAKKTLPQLLALVPVLHNLLVELSFVRDDDDAAPVHEHVVQLLELPWDVRSIAHLLELLRENTSLVSASGWIRLRESVQQLVLPPYYSTDLPGEALNPLLRECLLLAACSESPDEAVSWLQIARFLFRSLPVHLRQEAEFNVQMCLHQSPTLPFRICDAVNMCTRDDTSDAEDDSLRLDCTDAVLLLHSIRASKPLLHQHLLGSSHAPTSEASSVFSTAQSLMARILETASADECSTKAVRHALVFALDFGGRQQHSRVWKAQMLIELALVWINTPTTSQNPKKNENTELGSQVLECIFAEVAQVREGLLQNLLEMTRMPVQSKTALRHIERLATHHAKDVVPHHQLFQDWVGTIASSTSSGRSPLFLSSAFRSITCLVTASKEFFNFAMVFLRKQLSTNRPGDRLVAITIWCSWFERDLPLDAQQEEEIVTAIKHAIQLQGNVDETSARAFGCVESLFHLQTPTSYTRLRPSSMTELHRLLSGALSEFLKPAEGRDALDTSYDMDPTEEEEEEGGDHDDDLSRFRRYQVLSADRFSSHHASLAISMHVSSLIESIVRCVVRLECAMAVAGRREGKHIPTTEDARLGHSVLRWINALVRHHEDFFQWIINGYETEEQYGVGDKRYALALAYRISLGCGMCNIALSRHLQSGSRYAAHRWELLEIQFALARLWRRFTASTPSTDAQREKQFDAKLMETAAVSLRPHVSHLIQEITGLIAGEDSRPQHKVSLSLDTILFVLDAYIDAVRTPSDSPSSLPDTGNVLPSLVQIYNKVARDATSPKHSQLASVTLTTYSEALAKQFPKSTRPFVVPDNATSLIVAVDARAADELLSRICVALGRVLDAAGISSATDSVIADLIVHQEEQINNGGLLLLHTSQRLLSDLKPIMDNDTYTKFKVASASLVHRLIGIASRRCKDKEEKAIMDQVLVGIAESAFALLCEHVIHQLPLLRALLALSFRSSASIENDVNALDRVSAVMEVAGFPVYRRRGQLSDKLLGSSKETKPRQREQEPRDTPKKDRRRLRQIRDSDDEHPEAEPQTADNDDERDTWVVAALPRLTTSTAQATALLASLTLLDTLHTQCCQRLTSTTRGRPPTKPIERPDQDPTMQQCAITQVRAIHSLLSSTIFSSRDVSWISSRALTKLLNILVSAVRVAKSLCASVSTSRPHTDAVQASITVVARGRAWLAHLRDSAEDTAAKSKLSSTILKLDVLLLHVPSLVAAVLKTDSLPVESRRSIRAFLASIEGDITFSSSSSVAEAGSASKKNKPKSTGTKRHLVGVVPIVAKKRRTRLRSRHPFIDSCLADEDGDDAFADLEDFIA